MILDAALENPVSVLSLGALATLLGLLVVVRDAVEEWRRR